MPSETFSCQCLFCADINIWTYQYSMKFIKVNSFFFFLKVGDKYLVLRISQLIDIQSIGK